MPLPELIVTPTHAQVFMFSAATWNRHHIHYSKDAALAEGLPDVVVQRALIGNFFARMLTDALAGVGEICELSWKMISSAVPGSALRVHGEARRLDVRDGQRAIECELRMDDPEGRTIASATALVRLHPEGYQ
jgi:hydroxyacyl-ACP dehydratase HTD2-like protein with hotdog domain